MHVILFPQITFQWRDLATPYSSPVDLCLEGRVLRAYIWVNTSASSCAVALSNSSHVPGSRYMSPCSASSGTWNVSVACEWSTSRAVLMTKPLHSEILVQRPLRFAIWSIPYRSISSHKYTKNIWRSVKVLRDPASQIRVMYTARSL